MKTLGKVVGATLVCGVLLLAVLRTTGCGPHGRAPGLWLSGDVVATPVADWSFAADKQTVEVQTNTWYLLPHSVTTYCVVSQSRLYLPSIYHAGVPAYPRGRHWNANVARDSHVRIKIGDKLYDRTLVYVTDPAEKAVVLAVKAKKYPQQKIAADSTVNLFRVNDE
jgi:hypothetical protein